MHPGLSTAYSKRNCLWPVSNGGSGWERGSLLERYDAAVRHFVRTPRGSLICDPNYGTDVYLLRTQSAASDSLAEAYKMQLDQGFHAYLPELQLVDVAIEPGDSDEEEKLVVIAWKISGAEEGRHGDLARVQSTKVPIV